MTHEEKTAFVRNTLLVLFSQAAIMAVGFLLRPSIARLLGPTEYGAFALVLSTAAVLPLFTEFGAAGAVHYLAAKYASRRRIVANILTTAVATTLFFYALVFIPITAIAAWIIGPQAKDVFSMAFIVALTTSLFYILQNVQQALEKFKEYSLSAFFSALLSGLLALGGAFFFKSASASVLLRAAGALIVAVAGLLALKRFGRFDKERLKELVAYNAPLVLASLFSSFPAIIDRYLLTYFHTLTDVGLYDIAYTLAFAIMPFSSALLPVMAPRIVKKAGALPSYSLQVSRVMGILVTSFGLLLFFFSEIIIHILLGPPYEAAVPVLRIISLGLPFAALVGINSTSLTSLKKLKAAGVLSVMTAALLFTLNFVLVPPWGSQGAALASVTTFIIIAVAGAAYLVHSEKINMTCTLRQWGLFFLFCGAYFLIGGFGFFAKLAGYAVFLASTFAIHRPLMDEMIHILHSQITKMTRASKNK